MCDLKEFGADRKDNARQQNKYDERHSPQKVRDRLNNGHNKFSPFSICLSSHSCIVQAHCPDYLLKGRYISFIGYKYQNTGFSPI